MGYYSDQRGSDLQAPAKSANEETGVPLVFLCSELQHSPFQINRTIAVPCTVGDRSVAVKGNTVWGAAAF